MLCGVICSLLFFVFKQKTAYEMRISDWSSDVCSSDLGGNGVRVGGLRRAPGDEHAAGAGGASPIGACGFVSGGFRGNASSGQGGAFAAGREQDETGDDRQDASHGGAHRGTAWVIRRRAGACRDAAADMPRGGSPAAPGTMPKSSRRHPRAGGDPVTLAQCRSEEHTSELQSLMRSYYAVVCLKQ